MSIAITEHILVAYDIIGDVHGYSEMLECLLAKMGYQRRSGTWSHASRTAVFVGDFIDRGPGQVETLRIVRDMIDGGHAFAVMGNHELNAIGYWTPHPTKKGAFLRARNEKNEHQHGAFLRAVTLDSALHGEWVNWFMSLPLWLDLGDIRVIHACWYEPSIQMVQAILGGTFSSQNSCKQPLKRDIKTPTPATVRHQRGEARFSTPWKTC